MNKYAVTVIKKTTSFVVGSGTGRIVSQIIANNVQADTLISKITITAAAVAIGYMAAEKTSKFTDEKIDEFVALIDSTLNKEEETTEEIVEA